MDTQGHMQTSGWLTGPAQAASENQGQFLKHLRFEGVPSLTDSLDKGQETMLKAVKELFPSITAWALDCVHTERNPRKPGLKI